MELQHHQSDHLLERPIAPLWARGLAFVVDILILFLAWYLIWEFAPAIAFAVGDWSTPLQFALLVLYFALLDGPLGGQTLGKSFLNIRTGRQVAGSDAFLPLDASRALARATIKMAPLMLMVGGQHLTREADDSFAMMSMGRLLYQAGLGLLLANIAHIVMSPRGVALHDAPAGSLTGRDPLGPVLAEWLVSESVRDAESQVKPMRTATLVLMVVIAMSSCQIVGIQQQLANPDIRARLDYSIASLDLAEVDGIRPSFQRLSASPIGAAPDGFTTVGLSLQYGFSRAISPEVDLAAARDAGRRLLDKWESAPDDFVKYLMGGVEKHRLEVVRVEVWERTAFLGFQMARFAGSHVFPTALPPPVQADPATSEPPVIGDDLAEEVSPPAAATEAPAPEAPAADAAGPEVTAESELHADAGAQE